MTYTILCSTDAIKGGIFKNCEYRFTVEDKDLHSALKEIIKIRSDLKIIEIINSKETPTITEPGERVQPIYVPLPYQLPYQLPTWTDHSIVWC